MQIVVTAIQGLIDAADEQLNKRENSEDLSKVSKFAKLKEKWLKWLDFGKDTHIVTLKSQEISAH